MSRYVFAVLTLLGWGAACAAEDVSSPPYNIARWQEDYRYLADPDKQSDFFDPIKYIVVGDGYLTLGGQLREEGIRLAAPLYGTKDARGDTYLLHRFLGYADWHLSDRFRAFVELADELAPGQRKPHGVIDQDRADVQLAFLDYNEPLFGGSATARLGRQEIFFDPTERFLAVREGPNVRQAFDGARLDWSTSSLNLTLFAADPVDYTDRALFDDGTNTHIHFGGLHSEYTPRGILPGVIDTYFYRYIHDDASFGAAQGREVRDALGLRYAGKQSSFDWDVEAMQQRGHVGAASVNAWAASAIVGYSFDHIIWKPRVYVQVDTASGDKDPHDSSVETFNPLFPKGGYFTEAAVTGFSNLRHRRAGLVVRPLANTSIAFSYGELSRESRFDAAYAQPLVPIPNTATLPQPMLSNYAQFLASHDFNRHFSLELELARYDVTASFRAAGGHDVNFAKLEANFLF